jgi:predicted porin
LAAAAASGKTGRKRQWRGMALGVMALAAAAAATSVAIWRAKGNRVAANEKQRGGSVGERRPREDERVGGI